MAGELDPGTVNKMEDAPEEKDSAVEPEAEQQNSDTDSTSSTSSSSSSTSSGKPKAKAQPKSKVKAKAKAAKASSSASAIPKPTPKPKGDEKKRGLQFSKHGIVIYVDVVNSMSLSLCLGFGQCCTYKPLVRGSGRGQL